jgi:hypothetical protein
MYPKRIIPPGARFGRWTILHEVEPHRALDGKGYRRFRVRCDCGTEAERYFMTLRLKTSNSCGCLRQEVTARRNYRHGLADTPEYLAWQNMWKRCTGQRREDYRLYGGRGITVCPEWKSFETFYADMGPKPSPRHSLDRLNNDGPYSRENCAWRTLKEQGRNKRSNRLLTLDGETRPLVAWAELLGIDQSTLWTRLDDGWSVERALTTHKGSR